MTNITSGRAAPVDRLMGVAMVLEVLQVSEVTLWRWLRLGNFPQPNARISKRRYWRESVVSGWLEKQAPREPVTAAAAVA